MQPLSATVINFLEQGLKINAIKALREERNVTLTQAKVAIDEYLATRPELKGKAQEGNWFGFGLLLFLIAASLIYVFLLR